MAFAKGLRRESQQARPRNKNSTIGQQIYGDAGLVQDFLLDSNLIGTLGVMFTAQFRRYLVDHMARSESTLALVPNLGKEFMVGFICNCHDSKGFVYTIKAKIKVAYQPTNKARSEAEAVKATNIMPALTPVPNIPKTSLSHNCPSSSQAPSSSGGVSSWKHDVETDQ
ncbi:hypothetical protein DFQ26_002819 [Actinomortierella ambigua]|nr:hypothetical protein DFQ26_002819 [Actinomortierella ambigua]